MDSLIFSFSPATISAVSRYPQLPSCIFRPNISRISRRRLLFSGSRRCYVALPSLVSASTNSLPVIIICVCVCVCVHLLYYMFYYAYSWLMILVVEM